MVSVVVTTKNEERTLEPCLRSIALQTYSPIELIVVDNGSTDQTKEIARRFTDEVFDHGPERSAQRNYGMLTAATGQYVMYVDADMILSPTLVEACVRRISRGDCVALHLPEIILGSSYFSRVRRFERTFYEGTVIDAARFYYRDVLRQVGGFDDSITGVEDWDLDKKIKHVGRIVLLGSDSGTPSSSGQWDLADFIEERGVAPETYGAVVFHDESDFRLGPYLRKKSYYVNWLDAYVKKWPRSDPDVRRQLGFSYRYFSVFLENGKWKRLLEHPILTGGMYFLRGLVGATYLWRTLTLHK